MLNLSTQSSTSYTSSHRTYCQNGPSIQETHVSTHEQQPSEKFALEMQQAGEWCNIAQMINLIHQGANPNQKIPFTENIARFLMFSFVTTQLDCEGAKKILKAYSESQIDALKNPIAINIVRRIQKNMNVSDQEVQALVTKLVVEKAFLAHPEKLKKLYANPLKLALCDVDFNASPQANYSNFQRVEELQQLGATLNDDSTSEGILECMAILLNEYPIKSFV